MGLTLIVGDRNAGKTGVLYARARDAARAGVRVAVLVPSGPERDRAAREFAADLPCGIAVATLDAFLDELWDAWGDGRRPVREVERLLLLEHALDASREEWVATVPETAMRRMMPVLVERAAETPGGGRSRRTGDPWADALLAALGCYEGLLRERALIERAAAQTFVAERIGEVQLPDVICVNRFETFTPPQLAFLEAAARSGVEVLVAITFVEGSVVTRAAADVVARLARLPGAEVVRVDGGPSASHEELLGLQRSLRDAVSEASPTGAVMLAPACGSRAEAAAAARAVSDMVESGIPAEEVALVVPRARERIRDLAVALDDAGIPWRYEGTWRFMDSGLGRAVISLLRFIERGEREDLSGLMRSGYVGRPEESDAFLAGIRRRRPASGDGVWEEALGAPGEARKIIAKAHRLRSGGPAEGWSEVLAALADSMFVNRHGPAPVGDRTCLLDAAARQLLVETADALSDVSGGLQPGRLVRVLEAAAIAAHDGGRGVVVTTPERVRSRRFDAVVFVGLRGDEYPRSGAGWAVPRAVSEALGSVGIDVRPRTDLDAERLLFYQVVTGARKRLVLIWQDLADDGRVTGRSPFVDELLEAYAEQGAVPMLDAGASGRPRPGHAPTCVGLRRADDALTAAEAAEILQRREVFSASELEAYLRCPRQWLYEHGVRPRGLDLEIDARRRGSMAHAMLQRFYVRWQEIGHARVTEADLDHALAVHAAVAEAVLADSPAPESLEERAEGERAVRGSRRVIERDASSFPGFAPIGHEVAFGGDDEGLDLGGWRISGRIDRIDAGEEGLVVMDYKSGEGRAWASFEKRGVLQAPLYALVAQRLYDRPVVGMLYRSMSAHQDRGAYIEGAVSSPWLAKADACDAATLDELVERAIQRASGAVEGIRAGRFPCEPAEREVCSWCVARTWCEGSAS